MSKTYKKGGRKNVKKTIAKRNFRKNKKSLKKVGGGGIEYEQELRKIFDEKGLTETKNYNIGNLATTTGFSIFKNIGNQQTKNTIPNSKLENKNIDMILIQSDPKLPESTTPIVPKVPTIEELLSKDTLKEEEWNKLSEEQRKKYKINVSGNQRDMITTYIKNTEDDLKNKEKKALADEAIDAAFKYVNPNDNNYIEKNINLFTYKNSPVGGVENLDIYLSKKLDDKYKPVLDKVNERIISKNIKYDKDGYLTIDSQRVDT